MKQIILTIAIFSCVVAQTSGQVTVGLRIATSPAVTPGTNHIFVNRLDPQNESLFNVDQVRFSQQIGLMTRIDRDAFWLMGELLYGQKNTSYSMVQTSEYTPGQVPAIYGEKQSYLELPVSIGASIGIVDVFSGLSATKKLSYHSELSVMPGFVEDMPTLSYGWHMGAGVNLGHILLDIRYSQQFGSYGQGRFINGQELLLKNAEGRLVVSAGLRI
jgi:hypothetical protein